MSEESLTVRRTLKYFLDEFIWCGVETGSHMVEIEWIQLIALRLIELTELIELSILWNQQRPLISREVVVSFV